MSVAPGKTLEAFIRDALTAWPAWHHNFDNTGEVDPRGGHKRKQLRPADKIAFLPPDGRGALIECKECKSGLLAFSRLEPHQEGNLYRAAAMGAMAIIATSFKFRARWRLFLLWYTDFAHLRRSSGRASIPLGDLQRPPCLIELKKLRPPADAWDLFSGVSALASLDAAPLHHQTPTQERRGF